ncbi:hypothetical protein Tco_1374010, partial [Tanacetum coccineum]
MYKEGDASTISDIEFEGMTVIGLMKKLKGTCQFPIKGIFFLIPGKELSNGLIEMKDDSDLAESDYAARRPFCRRFNSFVARAFK